MRRGDLERCLGEPSLRSGSPRRRSSPQRGQDWALWSALARNAPLRGLPRPRTPAPRFARGYRLEGSATGLLASSPLPSAECARALSRLVSLCAGVVAAVTSGFGFRNRVQHAPSGRVLLTVPTPFAASSPRLLPNRCLLGATPPAGVLIGYRLPMPLPMCSKGSPSSGGGFRNLPRLSSGDGLRSPLPLDFRYFMCSLYRALQARRRLSRRPSSGGPRPALDGLGGTPAPSSAPPLPTVAPFVGTQGYGRAVSSLRSGVFIG